ncbi:MAG: DUF4202 domain-containing protein [Planctomycetota bacterium]|jgi:hypothetical protein|nr:DUF4202 domain-containing protein [Planctomycetota bacterium]
MDEQVYQAARAAIDAAHAADPKKGEADYADSIEHWIERLLPDPEPRTRLAARCQHLERWAIPRSSFPAGRTPYLQWRIAVHERQGERAQEILLAAGASTEDADVVAHAVAKHRPKEPLPQALEDAACLVFLEQQAADFIAGKDYDDDKVITIVQRTWKKMSARAHELAHTIHMEGRLKELVGKALAG